MCFLIKRKCPEAALQKRSKYIGDHPCYSAISVKLHSKISSINLQFWDCLDCIKIKVITMVVTSVMLVSYNLL